MAHQATARANTKLNMFLIQAMGAAYGTAKSGTGIAAMAVMRPEAIMKSIIPVSGFDFEILISNVPIHILSKFSRVSSTPGRHGGDHRHLRGGGGRPHRRPARARWGWLRLHTLQVRPQELRYS